ncbi:hypothetical protein BTUL_0018g00100 [Botrytis tulipae]|uniref:Uncharacterized protein n=1 Tax=Botrytis tulipae TaxID=87230 RepID=A0A4Z1F3G9_9HELO|nr:hypothetical protein BTUL_0018g00100 [Botrytis tulipae]
MALPNNHELFNALNNIPRPEAVANEKIQQMEEYIQKLDTFLKDCKTEFGKVSISKQKWERYQVLTASYESKMDQLDAARRRLEELWNDRDERKVKNPEEHDKASAARIRDILDREQQDAESMVGEAYALILLNDKSLEHIRGLSPATKRLLENAELLPLRSQINDLQEQLSNAVQVPGTLPDVNLIHELREKLQNEEQKNKRLNDKVNELNGRIKNLNISVKYHKDDAKRNLDSWNDTKVKVSQLNDTVREAENALVLESKKFEAMRKRYISSFKEQEAEKSASEELHTLKHDYRVLENESEYHENFFCSCIGILLEIQEDMKNRWGNIFRNAPYHLTEEQELILDHDSSHQLWLVQDPITSRNGAEHSDHLDEVMTLPMNSALRLIHQFQARPSKVEEPGTLRLISHLTTKVTEVDQYWLGQVSLSCFRVFHSYGAVENNEDVRPSFLHGLTSLAMMILIHHMAMSYPVIQSIFSIDEYICNTTSQIDPDDGLIFAFSKILPKLTNLDMDKAVDALRVHFKESVIHYPLHNPSVIAGKFELDVIGLTMITEPNFEWVMIIEHKDPGEPNLINMIEKSLFKLSDTYNNVTTSTYCIADCSKFANLLFDHGETDREYQWWKMVTSYESSVWSVEDDEMFHAICMS